MKSSSGNKKTSKTAARGKGAAVRSAQAPRSGKFPFVCVGASAGGLEAFVQLLEHLPSDLGMAYILVQHLDPRHESMLAGIISRATRMPVVEVKDGMRVKPDHVYVIPPNVDMAILHGSLSLMPRPSMRGPHLAIDYFLRSLARDQKDQAIAVILSGTASDGAQGVKEIKGESGITFAQDEKSAKYPGMPLSAIATGCIDFVLPPKEIARELGKIGRHPYLMVKKPVEHRQAEPEGDEETSKVFILVRDATGVDFSLYKQTMMRRRILRRMALHKLERTKDYIRFLRGNPGEVTALYRDFLINVTSFFRDAEAFQAMKKRVLPAIVKGRHPSAPLRIWVPGCSSGEEVYSIGILLLEVLGGAQPAGPVQIFGTDIDERSIEKARAGIYPDSIAGDVSPERLRRFFVKSDPGYQVSKAIRDMCVFARQNLIKDPPFSKMDLISCRNVLIYMKPVLQRKVLSIFHYALRPAGTLLLGTSESVGELADLYKAVDRQGKIYAKKESLSRAPADFVPQEPPPDLLELPTRAEDYSVLGLEKVHRDADRIALDRYAPPGVLVNEQMAILQFRGQIEPYLAPAPGRASLNLLRMAREGLAPELRKAVEKAKATSRPVRKEGLRIRHDGKTRGFHLEVIPIRAVNGNEFFYLVLFDEAARGPMRPADLAGPRPAARIQEAGKPQTGESRIAELEMELSSMKEYLRTVLNEQETANEAVRAASEEIQSSNEELQSTNEELETAKEELQSTNEELITLNEEIGNRNVELSGAYNDLTNVLNGVNLPVVILETNLRIRRLTPAAEKALNLIPSDVGRPLHDIKLSVQVPDLEGKILRAIETATSVEEEVQNRDGNVYLMRIKPYLSPERRIDGAILSFLDISGLKVSYEKLARAVEYANAIIETTREPLVVLDGTLRVRMVNRAFCETFRIPREETENRFLQEVGKGEWNNPRLRELLLEVLPRDHQVRDFRVETDIPHVGRRTLLFNARRLPPIEGGVPSILLSIEEGTAGPQGRNETEGGEPARSAVPPSAGKKKTPR
jgi:two-component system CheB/CheR fusion protein